MADTVANDEVVYRRIAVSTNQDDPQTRNVSHFAFRANEYDTTGFSLSRARSEEHPDFQTIEQATDGPSSRGYYVAELRVGDLREKCGINVEPAPLPHNPGHAEITSLTYANRRTATAVEAQQCLAKSVSAVYGPFGVH